MKFKCVCISKADNVVSAEMYCLKQCDVLLLLSLGTTAVNCFFDL